MPNSEKVKMALSLELSVEYFDKLLRQFDIDKI